MNDVDKPLGQRGQPVDTSINRQIEQEANWSLANWQFTWNYRELYNGIENDGSKKGNRYHHGLLTQQVLEVIKETGKDFGGFQDHSLNGGSDVQSLGYDEFIAPLIKSVQELTKKITDLEEKIKILENKQWQIGC